MKKLLALTAFLMPGIIAGASQRLLPVTTFNTQIIIGLDSAAAPVMAYYGPVVKGDPAQATLSAEGSLPALFPVYGNYPEGGKRVEHHHAGRQHDPRPGERRRARDRG